MHHNCFWLPANLLLLLCRKNGSVADIESASLRMYHIKMVSPIIDYTSFFIISGLNSARKRHFYLYLMNSEDQLFPSAIIFSIMDAGPLYRNQNPRINFVRCDKQQPRGLLAQCIKISLKCPNVHRTQRARLSCRISAR
jgi:hypothetical protein